MYFAYFDESGDSGLEKRQTDTFVLACALVHDKQWLTALDRTVSFRTYLKENFHIPHRAELKATWLIHNKADIRQAKLAFEGRMAAYKAAMRFQRTSGVFRMFAILIDKKKINKKDTDVRETAWRYAIQRLERYGAANNENVHVIPDEGHSDFIKKKIRQMRRFNRVPSAFGLGTLKRNAENILEDPSERRSRESFFVQFADLNAYAAFRNVYPAKNVGADLWEELGDARIAEVTKLKGGAPCGIVVWPP